MTRTGPSSGKGYVRKKRRQPEANLQRAVVIWLRYQYPKLLFWHVPNGGDFPVQRKRALADLGVRPGCPDLMMLLDDGRIGMIELKAGRSSMSDAQHAFADAAVARGALFACCRSREQVQSIVRLWLGPTAQEALRDGAERAA